MFAKKPQVLLTLDEELLERIEDYRYSNRIPNRSEAMRNVIKMGGKNVCKNPPDGPKGKNDER
jgi:metal-responsive CopG/Arc/MetJ family transcriptional regulator